MLQCFVDQNAHVYIKTVNMVVFFVKSNENTHPKGRVLMKMYRVVSITKRGNSPSMESNVGPDKCLKGHQRSPLV